MSVYPIFEIFMVCSGWWIWVMKPAGFDRCLPRRTGFNVLTMVRSGQKIVNSLKAFVVDNRTQN
jgi:hypothetical protein